MPKRNHFEYYLQDVNAMRNLVRWIFTNLYKQIS